MFVIWWGNYNNAKERGIVGDKCLHCGRTTAMHVAQHYQVPHVYFIPLGPGSLLATVLTCSECGGRMNGALEAYRRVIPSAAAVNMPLGKLLAETNPRLNDVLAYRAGLVETAREVRDVTPGAADPRVELAFARLAEVSSPLPEVYKLQGRLSQWASLDAATQAQLLRDINEVVAEDEKQEAAVRFVGLMGQRFKPDIDAGLTALTMIVVAALVVVGSYLLLGDSVICASVFVSIPVAGGAAALVHRALRRRAHRKFFRDVFLPEAHYQELSIVRILAVLHDPTRVASDPGTKGMLAALPLLHQVLKEGNPEGTVVEAAASLASSYPPRLRRALPVSDVSQGARRVETVLEEQEERDAAARFVRVVGQSFKPDVDGGVAFLVLFVTGALLITLAAFLLSGVALFVGILVAIAAAIVAAVVTHRKFRRFSQRRFFLQTFLPGAHYQGVSVARAIAILEDTDPDNPGLQPGLRGMARLLPVLREILHEASPDGSVSEAAAELAKSYPDRPTPPRSFRWVEAVVVAMVFFLCAGGLYWAGSAASEQRRAEEEARNQYVAPFVARMAEFTPAAPERDIQEPYRRGKVIPINLAGDKGIDTILLSLPEPLKPSVPDDVGTIVWLEWGQESVGHYTDNVEAFMITCKVTVIDRSKGVIIAEREFVGGPPPDRRRRYSDPNHGSNPANEIVAWLARMPVK
jgi:hypothetical protein